MTKNGDNMATLWCCVCFWKTEIFPNKCFLSSTQRMWWQRGGPSYTGRGTFSILCHISQTPASSTIKTSVKRQDCSFINYSGPSYFPVYNSSCWSLLIDMFLLYVSPMDSWLNCLEWSLSDPNWKWNNLLNLEENSM